MKTQLLNIPTFLLPILMVMLCGSSGYAQNEISKIAPIAYSYPVTPLTIDGELDDWPSNAAHYPIDKVLWNGKHDGAQDLSAYFMTGYNKIENAFYLAVVVEDNEHVLGESADDQNYVDAYILYLNEQNYKTGSGVASYIIKEHQNQKLDAKISWDPKMETLSSWENISYKVMSKGTQRIYEFKIILDAPIYDGRVIGIGHIVDDKDQDGQTSYAWIGRSGKSSSARPGSIGMLVFNKDSRNVGILSGRVKWQDPTITRQQPEGVYVHEKSNSNNWYYLPTNRNSGRFEATLPSVDYIIKPGKAAFFNGNAFYKADTLETMSVSVIANETTGNVEFELHAIPKPYLGKSANLLYDINDAARDEIDRAINAYMEYYQIEGLSFAVFKDDKLSYTKAYGVKNNYTKEKVDENTLFEVASITKPVFAYAVLRLYEKGIIDLDEPLYKYLPFEKSSNTAYNKLLTARMILSHKSGLPNWDFTSDVQYKFKPGTSYGYSGEGYEYLKRVIEKITRKDINDVLNNEVVIPLGLENMHFKKNEIAMQLKANGHSNTFTRIKRMPSNVGVAHSLVTNPKSLAKFIIALENRIGLKAETFDMMFSNQTSLPEDTKSNFWNYKEYMGLGIFIEESPYGKVIRHSGDNGDFRAIFRLYDDLDMGYIITTNGNSGRFILDNIERILVDPKKLSKSYHARMK